MVGPGPGGWWWGENDEFVDVPQDVQYLVPEIPKTPSFAETDTKATTMLKLLTFGTLLAGAFASVEDTYEPADSKVNVS